MIGKEEIEVKERSGINAGKTARHHLSPVRSRLSPFVRELVSSCRRRNPTIMTLRTCPRAERG